MRIDFSKEKSFLIRLFRPHKCISYYEEVESIPSGMIMCSICKKYPNFLEAVGWRQMNYVPMEPKKGKKK